MHSGLSLYPCPVSHCFRLDLECFTTHQKKSLAVLLSLYFRFRQKNTNATPGTAPPAIAVAVSAVAVSFSRRTTTKGHADVFRCFTAARFPRERPDSDPTLKSPAKMVRNQQESNSRQKLEHPKGLNHSPACNCTGIFEGCACISAPPRPPFSGGTLVYFRSHLPKNDYLVVSARSIIAVS